ncbi:hypothetical protein [Tardisphaera saccharovorans]|nr:hypothetical protein [TACK group archaeon]
MKAVDLVFEGKHVEFEFNGKKVGGECELETKNTLVVKGKTYPKRSLAGLKVEGRSISRVFYERSLEERLKRLLGE